MSVAPAITRNTTLVCLKIILAIILAAMLGLEHAPSTATLIVLKDYIFRIALPA